MKELDFSGAEEQKPFEQSAVGAGVCIINKIQTHEEGGFRVILDFSNTDLDLIQKLITIKTNGPRLLYVAFVDQGHKS